MESRGSVTARESFPSVSLQYQKLLTSNEYSVRVWDVNDPFAFPFKRSSLFPPRHGQTYHPGMWRSQTQFDKFARMSMFSEGLSRQSPLFSPKQQRRQSVDVKYPYLTSLYSTNVTAPASKLDKKEDSSGSPSPSAQEPPPINNETANISTEKSVFLNNGMEEKKMELCTGKTTRQDEEGVQSEDKFILAMREEGYWERRRKNNLSAKRSRDARRLREKQTQKRATFFEEENLRIRAKINALEDENHRLRRLISNQVWCFHQVRTSWVTNIALSHRNIFWKLPKLALGDFLWGGKSAYPSEDISFGGWESSSEEANQWPSVMLSRSANVSSNKHCLEPSESFSKNC